MIQAYLRHDIRKGKHLIPARTKVIIYYIEQGGSDSDTVKVRFPWDNPEFAGACTVLRKDQIFLDVYGDILGWGS